MPAHVKRATDETLLLILIEDIAAIIRVMKIGFHIGHVVEQGHDLQDREP
jgi:hypothetical protein